MIQPSGARPAFSSRLFHFARLLLLATALLLGAGSSRAAVIYVNAAASGANNGTSWASAFTELVSGINAAQAGDEIWVAAGIYYPDYDPQTGAHTGIRNMQFALKSNVSYFGGFAGNETIRSQRNWAANRTVLSGNILQTGTFAKNTMGLMAWPSETTALTGAVVEGFVFAGGDSDNPDEEGDGSDTGCGGAIYIGYGSLDVRYCTFVGNYAVYGGAIAVEDPATPGLTVENCLFANNTSKYNGGAIQYEAYGGHIAITNCTFVNNYGTDGSAFETNENVTHSIINNLIFGNTGAGPDQIDLNNSAGICAYNVSQVPLTGGGNIVIAAANFAQTPSPGPDGVWGTADDVITAPLAYNSPAINAASATYLPADTTDANGNGNATEPIPYDLAHRSRVLYGAPDAGAFEYDDTQTQPPTLTLPASGAAYGNPIPVNYTLLENALPGSVTLTFRNGSGSFPLTLGSAAANSLGVHTFSLNPANPTASSLVTSGGAIPDGTYTVTVSYQDIHGSPAASATNTNVTIQTVTPVLTLDSGALTYTEGNAATIISPGATASLGGNGWAGAELAVQITANATTSDFLGIGSSTGLTFSGNQLIESGTVFGTLNVPPDTGSDGSAAIQLLVASFNANATNDRAQRLVRALTFFNSSQNPSTATRTVTCTLMDAARNRTTATRQIDVIAVDNAPVVNTSTGGAIFTEGLNSVSTPVVIDPGVTVYDVDNITQASGAVSITGNFYAGEDILGFANNPDTMGNISGTYNAATGVLSLASAGATASLDQWQNALRSVTYTDNTIPPHTALRTVSFATNDGKLSSAAAARNVTVIETNQTPFAFSQTVNLNENTSSNITLTGSDPQREALTYSLVSSPLHGTLSGTAPGLVYAPSADYFGADSFQFAVTDGISTSSAGTVSISVAHVNQPPTLAALSGLQILENAGTQFIPLAGITTGAPNEFDTLTVTATSSNPGVIPNPSVQYMSADSGGEISFAPVHDANGSAVVTVTVDDGQSVNHLVSRSFTVTVTPVNQPPGFVAGQNIQVAQDAGPQTFPGWATAIVPGPPNEANQSVQFFLYADHQSLFSVQPALSPNGNLTFTPAPSRSGSATIEVTLHDNGGTANGGVDASSPQFFNIITTTNTNQFGLYTGLIEPDSLAGPAFEQAGAIRLTVGRKGGFTGAMLLGRTRFPLLGVFNAAGACLFHRGGGARLLLSRNGAPPLELALRLDVAGGTDEITGSLTESGSAFALITADRALYTASRNPVAPFRNLPAGLQGEYTVVFSVNEPGMTTTSFPQGSGAAILTVQPDGMASLIGRLPDGGFVSRVANISKYNTWPFYALLSGADASLAGPVAFANIPGVSDVSGSLFWFEPATGSPTARYPAGWPGGLVTNLAGSKFLLPPASAHMSLLPGLPPVGPQGNANVSLSLTDTGTFESGLADRVNINPDNTVTVVGNSHQLLLDLHPTGIFTGSFLDPVTNKITPIMGAIIQKQKLGAGYFIGTGSGGKVTITPAIQAAASAAGRRDH